MSLPLTIPASPASDDSSAPPQTPISPTNILPEQQQQQQMKRKPSRRANTAERRATHNAVERQRRETLNGRFLDLAALLPNLSQIRRPSKSSIVNSSIAHVQASRRHRLLASRELRLLKQESDALRRELNEWRDRAGLPRLEEPARGEGFAMVLSGEVEVLAAIPGDDDDEGEEYGEDEYPPHREEDLKPSFNSNNSSSSSQGIHLAHILPRPTPSIASGPAMNYENPAIANPNMASANAAMAALGYDQAVAYQAQFMSEADKVAAWNAQQMFTQRHGPGPNNGQMQMRYPGAFADPFYPPLRAHQHLPRYAGVDADDASSVGSAGSRGRSGSVGGSGYGSPVSEGGVGFEMGVGEYGRRGSLGMGMFEPPIGVGGGSGGGFAMMM